MKSVFTQKQYCALASFFKHELSIALAMQESAPEGFYTDASTRVNTIKGTIRLLTIRLQEDNRKFDHKRFFKACGLDA